MSGTEDYLDGLLNSLSEKDMDAEKETGSKTMRTEDDIMNEMENDLLSKEAEDNFLEQFEKELANEKSAPEAETKDDFFNSLDQIVDGTGQNNKEDDFMMDTLGDIPGIDDIMKKEEPAQTSEPQTDEKEESGQQENTKAPENLGGLGDLDRLGDFGISDDISEESADVTEGAQMTDYTDKGESDALGMEDAASDGLDDFGDLGEADIFGDDGAGESENTSDSMSDVMPNDREDKPKKESFLKKLSRILFGEDDEDEEGDPASSGKEVITEENAGDIDLSDPNMQILQELGDIPGISDAPKEEEKSDPEEDKKKKKEKKKKEKKPKKEKKSKKPKKEKKPKPPKEPDLTPPLPKVPVILIFVMVFSFLVLVVLATNLVGYSSSFSNAEDAYAKGNYEQAFQDVSGLEVKEKDQDTYRKYRILAYTAGQYRAYQNLMNQKIYDMALDSLISTIGRCDEYSSDAKELGCDREISDIQAKAEEALEAFKIDAQRALEVYGMKDRTAYSKEIYRILDDAGLSEE